MSGTQAMVTFMHINIPHTCAHTCTCICMHRHAHTEKQILLAVMPIAKWSRKYPVTSTGAVVHYSTSAGKSSWSLTRGCIMSHRWGCGHPKFHLDPHLLCETYLLLQFTPGTIDELGGLLPQLTPGSHYYSYADRSNAALPGIEPGNF